jgi:hypothetical protein
MYVAEAVTSPVVRDLVSSKYTNPGVEDVKASRKSR